MLIYLVIGIILYIITGGVVEYLFPQIPKSAWNGPEKALVFLLVVAFWPALLLGVVVFVPLFLLFKLSNKVQSMLAKGLTNVFKRN